MFPYFLTLLALLQPARTTSAGCIIIVNDANEFYSATAAQVADLFLEKRTTWQNGSTVTPVDQMPEAQVREDFSVAVLGRPLQAVQAYWRAKVYRDEAAPPPELGSDQEVIDYVKTHPAAIGYVTSDAQIPAGVHAIVVMR